MGTDETPGLVATARRLAGAVVDILGTRVELGATELQEARLRVARLAITATCALFLLGNGLVMLLLALAWWAGPAQGVWVLGGGAALLLAGAGAALWRWQRLLASQPPLLNETLAQLRADARALGGEP